LGFGFWGLSIHSIGAGKLTVQSWIGAIAGIFALAGFIPYWRAILQGKTHPNRATWWIWSFVGVVIAFSYRAAGANSTMWVPITYVIGPLVTSLLGIKFGEGGWTKLDRICLVGVGIGAILWGLNRSPHLTLGINIGIDFLGALPTIHKSFCHPDSEDRLAWLLFSIANALNLLAIDLWLWQIVIYPIYMFLVCITIYSLLWRGRLKQYKSDLN
jgi:nitrogen fixation-related uncharacterized protein